MTRSDDSVIPRLRKALGEHAPPSLASAYLFGSRAEGRGHGQSDVDLGVLFRWDLCPRASDRFDAGLRLATRLTASVGGPTVDVVVLNDGPPGFAARIVTEGRRILCADAETDHAFVRDAQLRAADLAPFLRRTLPLKLEALAR